MAPSLSLAEIFDTFQRRGLANQASPGISHSMITGTIRTSAEAILPGDIFVAYKGVRFDPHSLLPLAIAKGASLLIVESKDRIPTNCPCPWILVRSGREAWSWLAALLQGAPQSHMRFFGVTGTNGKTSVVWLANQILLNAGIKTLSIGTLGIFFNGKKHEIEGYAHTTPDPDLLYPILKKALDEGIRTVLIEVTSHSMLQEKLAPIRFSGGVWTSFSQDHLDYHPTMEDYFAAKWRFFSTYLKPDARVIVASDIKPFPPIQTLSQTDLWTYGASPSPIKDAQHLSLVNAARSTRQVILHLKKAPDKNLELLVPDWPDYNISNFMASVLLAEKVDGQVLERHDWRDIRSVPGRLEEVALAGQTDLPRVFVDFAHTPDALEKVLANAPRSTRGMLWVVFGCGGDRDQKKRPLMATAAESRADQIVVTSDNPRSEEPATILGHIIKGFRPGTNVHVESDRERAIAFAIKASAVDDTVIIAGKGHEEYQIIGAKKTPFSDQAVAREYLTRRSKGSL